MSVNTTINPVAILNDRLRTTFLGGQVLLTEGIQALSEIDKRAVLQAVQAYNDFSEESDPYGEHDFGLLIVNNQRYMFKVDYYDLALEYRSEDPADPAKTKRVLTILRADEY